MNDDMPEGTVIQHQTSSFTLKQSSKGEYYWEIKIYSEDLDEIKKKVVNLDNWAKKEYGGVYK